jgi:hypothetical protein
VSIYHNLNEKGETFGMKKYIAPELEALSFTAAEAISAPLEGSNTFNDGELEW